MKLMTPSRQLFEPDTQLGYNLTHWRTLAKGFDMITIYHLAVSQSDRVVWLMEELGLPYTLQWFDRGEDILAPPEYRALHPVGTAPIVKDGDVILVESAAIVEYISQRYGAGRLSIGVDHPRYFDYLYWMQFNNNIQSLFFVRMALAQSEAGADNPISITSARREEAYYHYLDQHLGKYTYLAGDDFSCADIMLMFNLTTLPIFGSRDTEDLPNVLDYVERVSQRPAYKRAMEIAGPGATRPS